MKETLVTSPEAPLPFPDLPAFPRAPFRAYGMATVRPYVGAVKRVALPIVSQAINPRDAGYFHRGPAGFCNASGFEFRVSGSKVSSFKFRVSSFSV